MRELSPAAINIGILAGGLFLYALIWYLTRGLPRFAKVLARLLPLGLVLPAMILLSDHNSPLRTRVATAPPPPAARPEPPPASAPPATAPTTSAPAPASPPPPPVAQPAAPSAPATDSAPPAAPTG